MAQGLFGQGGTYGPSTINDAAGSVSDLFAGFGDQFKATGDRIEAGMYREGADFAEQNVKFTEAATSIKEMQQQRDLEKSMGGTSAAVASAGFAQSGSALDILADSARQGALAHQVLGFQGLITEQGEQVQADALRSQANAADVAAKAADFASYGAFATSAIKGAAAVATLA